MSHVATTWAFGQRGLSPAQKLVLITLADCHNPAEGCFPSQDFIAGVCEISRASVNRHLDVLETRGLIRRVRALDAETKRQRPTRYLLAFEPAFGGPTGGGGQSVPVAPRLKPTVPAVGAANVGAGRRRAVPAQHVQSAPRRPVAVAVWTAPAHRAGPAANLSAVSQSEVKAVSQTDSEPCLNLSESRVSNCDNNLVRGTVRKVCVGGASAAHTSDDFERFWKSHPRPRDRARCQILFAAAVAGGVAPGWIAASAERYRAENAGNGRQYLAYADNWLDRERWTDFPEPQTEPDPGNGTGDPRLAAAAFWAKKVRERGYVPANAISAPVAALIRRHGMASDDDLRRAGVA